MVGEAHYLAFNCVLNLVNAVFRKTTHWKAQNPVTTTGRTLSDQLAGQFKVLIETCLELIEPTIFRNFHDSTVKVVGAYKAQVPESSSEVSPKIGKNWLFGIGHQSPWRARASN
jgi:hypothetical protein